MTDPQPDNTLPLHSISLDRFIPAFLDGCHEISINENTLNQINVFPVSDKDTGTNLTLTLYDAVDSTYESKTYKTFFESISERVFDNARGNSGVMFAIFLVGLSKFSPPKNSIDFLELSQIFHDAQHYLSDNLTDIAPGTLVTFSADFCQLFSKTIHDASESSFHLPPFLDELNLFLSNTTNQNPILKKNDVVDAGALAFFLFVKAMLSSLLHRKINHPKLTHNQRMASVSHTIDEEPNYRYCTEAKLVCDQHTLNKIKPLIQNAGDSCLFLSKGNTLKFHVHCNNPVSLFESLSSLAIIKSPKIDDMLRQYHIIKRGVKPIALLTDSSADLPEDLCEQYDIHKVPLTVLLGQHEYLDNVSIDVPTLYQSFSEQAAFPSTATPTLGVIRTTMQFLKKNYQHIIVITISSKLSSTFQTIQQIVQNDPQVNVIDSQTNSAAHGLLLLFAGRQIKEGLSVKDIISNINTYRKNLHIYISIDNMHALIRSGRVKGVKKFIAKISNIKPLITTSKTGEAVIIGKSFSTEKNLKKLFDLVKKHHVEKPIQYIAYLHVNALERANQLAEKIKHELALTPLFISTASAAIALHTGQGAVAVSFSQ